MKIRTLLTAVVLAASLALVACKSTNPATGKKEYDPVKTEQVKAAVEPILASGVRRVLANNPEHGDEIAGYMRSVGYVFLSASESGELGPEQIIEAADRATAGLQNGVDPAIIDGKNALIALYRILYGDRFKAELPPDKWPKHVADVIAQAVDQGLKDAGKPGLR